MPQSCPHNSEPGPQHDYHIGDFEGGGKGVRVRERGVGGEGGREEDRERGGQGAGERRRGGMRGMEEEKREESGKISYHKDHHR